MEQGGLLSCPSPTTDRILVMTYCWRDSWKPYWTTFKQVKQVDLGKAMAVLTFRALLIVLLTVSSSFFAVGYECFRYHPSSCSSFEVCCNHLCISGSSCIGRVCFVDSDCAVTESCCSGRCRSDCLDYSCSIDSDCGFREYYQCCDGTCSYDCYDPTAVIVGSVCGVLIFACLISMCFYYACRRRRVHHGRVIVGQRVTTATVRTTRTVPQPYPPYAGQIPPPYQQGYQYYPPPQYEHHQTAIPPPPYNPGTTATNDQPPPYSAATQGRSGGVYTPKPSYGAIQTPSAPPPV